MPGNWKLDPAAPAVDFEPFRRQRGIFAVLNLFLLFALLLLHAFFSSFWGKPRPLLIGLLSVCFLLRFVEIAWLRWRRSAVSPLACDALTWGSIALNLLLALALAWIIDREDSQYFALLVPPVLEAAARFSLGSTIGVVAASNAITFFWVWRYYHAHPPTQIGEYFEAGTVSMIFSIMAVQAWVMVKHLRQKQEELAKNLIEITRTRELLLREEKLAAVGRLSTAIAHELRNPVAIVSTSLTTAKRLAGPEREEMFEIAAREASRLVSLTTDFLAYARPRQPKFVSGCVHDTVLYVTSVCRPHLSDRGLQLTVEGPDGVAAEFDASMIQQALINLVMNALDASPPGATVKFVLADDGEDQIRIDIENPGAPIPDAVLSQVFEPFFTTKPAGTGLGLATARTIARAHGGDLALTVNGPDRVRFSMTLPKRKQLAASAGAR